MTTKTPIPREIGRANRHDILIEWKDGEVCVYPSRELRLECPCARCVDEMSGRRILQPESISLDVYPKSLELVGRYALRVYWSDNHSSGIYTFKLLRGLCPPE